MQRNPAKQDNFYSAVIAKSLPEEHQGKTSGVTPKLGGESQHSSEIIESSFYCL